MPAPVRPRNIKTIWRREFMQLDILQKYFLEFWWWELCLCFICRLLRSSYAEIFVLDGRPASGWEAGLESLSLCQVLGSESFIQITGPAWPLATLRLSRSSILIDSSSQLPRLFPHRIRTQPNWYSPTSQPLKTKVQSSLISLFDVGSEFDCRIDFAQNCRKNRRRQNFASLVNI